MYVPASCIYLRPEAWWRGPKGKFFDFQVSTLQEIALLTDPNTKITIRYSEGKVNKSTKNCTKPKNFIISWTKIYSIKQQKKIVYITFFSIKAWGPLSWKRVRGPEVPTSANLPAWRACKCNHMLDYFGENSLSLNLSNSGYLIINSKNDDIKNDCGWKTGFLNTNRLSRILVSKFLMQVTWRMILTFISKVSVPTWRLNSATFAEEWLKKKFFFFFFFKNF